MSNNINKKDLEQFKFNLNAKKAEITALQNAYITLQVLNEIIKERFAESYKQVFFDNVFYLEKDRSRSGKNKGDRATDENDMYCLSDADFERVLKLATAEHYKRGLTDLEGRYTEETNTGNKLIKLKQKIVGFSLELLPDGELKQTLKKAVVPGENYSYKTYEKMFDLFMQLKAE